MDLYHISIINNYYHNIILIMYSNTQKYGWSVLHFAAKEGNIDIVKLLTMPEHTPQILLQDHVSQDMIILYII